MKYIAVLIEVDGGSMTWLATFADEQQARDYLATAFQEDGVNIEIIPVLA